MAIKRLLIPIMIFVGFFVFLLPSKILISPADSGGGASFAFTVSGTVVASASGFGGIGIKTPHPDFANRTVVWPLPSNRKIINTSEKITLGSSKMSCSCNGTFNNPTSALCTVSNTTNSVKAASPSAGGGDGGGGDAPAGGEDAGGTTGGEVADATPKSTPLTALLPKSNATLLSPVATKDCPASGRYETGLLTGIPCVDATKGSQGLITVLLAIRNVITMLLLPLAGTVFLIMFIVGGLLYITSAGNDEKAKKAKQTLTAAIIGLIIVILAFTLIKIFTSAIGGGITKA